MEHRVGLTDAWHQSELAKTWGRRFNQQFIRDTICSKTSQCMINTDFLTDYLEGGGVTCAGIGVNVGTVGTYIEAPTFSTKSLRITSTT
jgi:hypothetical protein